MASIHSSGQNKIYYQMYSDGLSDNRGMWIGLQALNQQFSKWTDGSSAGKLFDFYSSVFMASLQHILTGPMASQMIGVDRKIALKCIEMDDGMMRLVLLLDLNAINTVLSVVTTRCHTHAKYWRHLKIVSTPKCTHRACNHAYQAAGMAPSPKRSAPGSWRVAGIQRARLTATSRKFI